METHSDDQDNDIDTYYDAQDSDDNEESDWHPSFGSTKTTVKFRGEQRRQFLIPFKVL